MKTIEELRIKLADLQKVRNVTDRDIEAVRKEIKILTDTEQDSLTNKIVSLLENSYKEFLGAAENCMILACKNATIVFTFSHTAVLDEMKVQCLNLNGTARPDLDFKFKSFGHLSEAEHDLRKAFSSVRDKEEWVKMGEVVSYLIRDLE